MNEDEGIPSTAIREIALLKQLAHANIVRLYDVIYTEKKLTLVFEYLDQDLKKYMDSRPNGMDLFRVRSFMAQLLSGIYFCHSNKVLHRDLKPQNLLINAAGELKLADFGLARIFGVPIRSLTPEVITLWYRPPEILMGEKQYLTPVDMWSIGCIFAEMVNRRPLFTGASDRDQLTKIVQIKGTPSVEDWPQLPYLPGYDSAIVTTKYQAQPWNLMAPRLNREGIELLGSLLEYNPKKRPPADRALACEYFKMKPHQAIQSTPAPQHYSGHPGMRVTKGRGM